MSLNSRLKPEQLVNGILFKIHPSTRFAVSSCGKILGRTGKILKPKSQGRYLIVSYQIKVDNVNKIRHFYVHRLVAEVWLEKTETTNEVNHIDGNRMNNDSKNLEWVNHKENMIHSVNNGLCWNCPKKGEQGFKSRYD